MFLVSFYLANRCYTNIKNLGNLNIKKKYDAFYDAYTRTHVRDWKYTRKSF